MQDINIDTLRQIVPLSLSWVALAKTFGLVSDARLKRLCREHQIDTSHMTGYRRKKGYVLSKKGPIPLEEWLGTRMDRNGDAIRKRLVSEGLKENKCECCQQTHWQEQPIPLELHHVNGDRLDHRLPNLQILCCNCHALTPNYKAKNQKKRVTRITTEQYREAITASYSVSEACQRLGISGQGGNLATVKRIMVVHRIALKTIEIPQELLDHRWVEVKATVPTAKKPQTPSKRPSKEGLATLIWEKPYTDIGHELGVTGGAVATWVKQYGIEGPPSGYWTRRHAGFTHEEAMISQAKALRPRQDLIPQEKVDLAKQMISEGLSLRRTAKAIGCHHSTLQYRLGQDELMARAKMAVSTVAATDSA